MEKRSQNAGSELLFASRIGYVRVAALKPAWGHRPQTPSSLRGGFKPLNTGELRSPAYNQESSKEL